MGFFLFLFSVSISYAANGKPCTAEKTNSKKQACKTFEKLLKLKLIEFKGLGKSSQPGSSSKTPATANTFETLITPF